MKLSDFLKEIGIHLGSGTLANDLYIECPYVGCKGYLHETEEGFLILADLALTARDHIAKEHNNESFGVHI